MRSALGFLTALGGPAPLDRHAPNWFAPVGFLVGLAVGGVWWAAGEAWAPLAAAALAVAADAALTGMLHLDGLADSADGLLPSLDPPRRLDVMAAPDLGAFGVVALVIALGLRTAGLASMTPDPLLVAGVWAGARAIMALTMAWVPSARPAGLGSAFGAERSAGVPVAALLGSLGIVVLAAGGPARGLVTAAALVAGSTAVVAFARQRIGGFTGDVLGAAGVVGETVALIVAAARW